MQTISFNSVDILGTSAASTFTPATLTASYSGNATIVSHSFPNGTSIGIFKLIGLVAGYTPNAAGVANSYCSIQIDFSNLASPVVGTDAHWFPFGTIVYGASESDVFGNPFITPGSKTSTPGTGIRQTFVISELPFRWLRISAKESVGSNFGTLYLGAGLVEQI